VKEAEAAMEASLKSHEDLERKLGTSLINLRKQMTPEESKVFFTERMERMQHDTDSFRNQHKDQNRHKFEHRR
jgi:hypothetical protein